MRNSWLLFLAQWGVWGLVVRAAVTGVGLLGFSLGSAIDSL